MDGVHLLRGQVIRFTGDPFQGDALAYESDGIVAVAGDRILAVGPAESIRADHPQAPETDLHPWLLAPAFVDAHAHFPQIEVIASYGEQLLEWLNKYTFPAESRFHDPERASRAAEKFLDEWLRNGIAAGSVFCTIHPQSVDAFFKAAKARGLRAAAGKVMMDRNAPEALRDTPQSAYDDSKALIDRWQGRGRLEYAITPRFSPTSTPAQLEAAGALWRERPACLMQTHLSENSKEIAWVSGLFPDSEDYLATYEAHGLLGPGAVFGHGIYLTEREKAAIADADAAVAHCPTSNLFIGSGLFDARLASRMRVGLATDVGGGSSFSMFQTMKAAYEIAQLNGYALSPVHAWWLATQGAARALRMDARIGNLAPGLEADVVAIDLRSTPLLNFRMDLVESIEEALFAQIILADDRAIRAVWAAGRKVYDVEEDPCAT